MFSTKGNIVLTRDKLLESLSEFDIFKYYIPSFEDLGKPFCSEIRADIKPSCKIFIKKDYTLYKDFSTGETYNCFDYVKLMFKYKYGQNITELELLQIISNDFNLGLIPKSEISSSGLSYTMGFTGEKGPSVVKKTNTKADIKIVSSKYTSDGFDYWNNYFISLDTLNLYQVKQLKGFYINDTYITIKRNEYAFAYDFDNYIYKVLNPCGAVEFKWFSNTDASIIQGLKQLPEKGDLLIITKSLKDVMVLRELGYWAIAPQSENTMIPIEVFNKLYENWKNIVIYFDNDSPGIEAAKKYSVTYGLKYFHNGVKSKKDPSDFIKAHGKESLQKKMKRLIRSVNLSV